MNTYVKVQRLGNLLGLLFICIALLIAFVDQVSAHDLPCPLCLLQRACFIAIGMMLAMNLFYGIKTVHYGFMLFSGLLGLAISVRQLYLHVSPGDAGYGDIFWGLHFYAWAAICFIVILAAIASALILEKGFNSSTSITAHRADTILIIGFILLIAANLFSTLFECGFSACPDNPVTYEFL